MDDEIYVMTREQEHGGEHPFQVDEDVDKLVESMKYMGKKHPDTIFRVHRTFVDRRNIATVVKGEYDD